MKSKGYWVVHIDVRDAENYKAYIAAGGEAIRNSGGRFLVRGGKHEQMEGSARARHIVIEFESYAHALAVYKSDEYQAAVALRKPYAAADLTIVEGPPEA